MGESNSLHLESQRLGMDGLNQLRQSGPLEGLWHSQYQDSALIQLYSQT